MKDYTLFLHQRKAFVEVGIPGDCSNPAKHKAFDELRRNFLFLSQQPNSGLVPWGGRGAPTASPPLTELNQTMGKRVALTSELQEAQLSEIYAVQANISISIDICFQLGKRGGFAKAASFTNEDGECMGIRACHSSSIMELGGYIDTCIRNRPGEPRELTAVIIDNMPPSGKGSYVSFLKKRFNCQHIMQDRWHIDHHFTVSANNMDPNYFIHVVLKWRNSTKKYNLAALERIKARYIAGTLETISVDVKLEGGQSQTFTITRGVRGTEKDFATLLRSGALHKMFNAGDACKANVLPFELLRGADLEQGVGNFLKFHLALLRGPGPHIFPCANKLTADVAHAKARYQVAVPPAGYNIFRLGANASFCLRVFASLVCLRSTCLSATSISRPLHLSMSSRVLSSTPAHI